MSDPLNKRVTRLEERLSHLERINAPRQKNITADPQHKNAQDENKGTEPVAARGAIRPAPDYCDTSQNKWYKTFGRWIWRFRTLEGIGIIAVVVYAWLTYQQWKDNSNAFKTDQRAWLTMRGFKLNAELTPDADFTLAILMQNTGKTPAVDSMVQDAWIIDASAPRPFQWVPNTAVNNGVIPPNAPDFYVEMRSPLRRPRSDEFREYQALRRRFYVTGMFRYRDIFRQEHWTSFCAFHSFGRPVTEFEFCGSGNDIDH